MDITEAKEVAVHVIAVASILSAVIPEPRTRFGKFLKRILDLCGSNVGHAKNKGVD